MTKTKTSHCSLKLEPLKESHIKVNPIKAFSDNFIWAITGKENYIALVDPGDADVCIEYIEAHQLQLCSLLITHYHADHVGGIAALVTYCKQKNWPLTVYGPKHEDIPHCDVKLIENDKVDLPNIGTTLSIIDLPGHTLGHIAYYNEALLFCGDTLFSGGCGRIFEGSAEQMYRSLNKLANLPNHTQVFCAHEYTQANVNFALAVDPENTELIAYFNHVNHLRSNNINTLPSCIGLELKINPFLRCNTIAIKTSAQEYCNSEISTAIEAFTAIRRWKDQF
ncbi:MAG: hydroxyacylglutathione hydrolase [Colwellia sp.]